MSEGQSHIYVYINHMYAYIHIYTYMCKCHDEIYYFTHQRKKVTAEASGQRIHGCHRPVGNADRQQDES